MTRSKDHRAVTASEVVQIVGPIDDHIIADVIATGATAAEVVEAYSWLSSRDYFHRTVHELAHGRVAQVYRILDAERRPAEQS